VGKLKVSKENSLLFYARNVKWAADAAERAAKKINSMFGLPVVPIANPLLESNAAPKAPREQRHQQRHWQESKFQREQQTAQRDRGSNRKLGRVSECRNHLVRSQHRQELQELEDVIRALKTAFSVSDDNKRTNRFTQHKTAREPLSTSVGLIGSDVIHHKQMANKCCALSHKLTQFERGTARSLLSSFLKHLSVDQVLLMLCSHRKENPSHMSSEATVSGRSLICPTYPYFGQHHAPAANPPNPWICAVVHGSASPTR
jgi:hypothetical protein